MNLHLGWSLSWTRIGRDGAVLRGWWLCVQMCAKICSCAQIYWDAVYVDASLLELCGKQIPQVSQQTTFMPQVLDYGSRHHHMTTNANEAPKLKILIPQKNRHPFGWIATCMSDITSTQPTRHTKYVCELRKPPLAATLPPKCIPKTCTQHLPTGHQSYDSCPYWVPKYTILKTKLVFTQWHQPAVKTTTKFRMAVKLTVNFE